MTKSNKIFGIIIFLIVQNLFASSQNIDIDAFVFNFKSDVKIEEFVLYEKWKSLPKQIRNEIKVRNEGRFRIANPNRRYNKTDVERNPLLKNRQLVFWAEAKGYYIIVYRKGGRVHNTCTLICKNRANFVDIVNLNLGKIDSLSDVINRLNKGAFLNNGTMY